MPVLQELYVERKESMTTLRDYLYDLVSEAGEKALKDELDEEAKQSLVEEYIDYIKERLVG